MERKPPKGKSLAEVNPKLAKKWHHLEREKLEQVNNSGKILKKIHDRYSLLNSFDYKEFCSNLDVIAFPIFSTSGFPVSRDALYEEKNPPIGNGIRILYKAPKKKLNQIKESFLKKSTALRKEILAERKGFKNIEQDFCGIYGTFYSLNKDDYLSKERRLSHQHELNNKLFEELLEYEYDYRYGELAFRCTKTNRINLTTSPIYYNGNINKYTGRGSVDSLSFYKKNPGNGVFHSLSAIWDLEEFYNTHVNNFDFYDKYSGYEYDNVLHILNDLEVGRNQFRDLETKKQLRLRFRGPSNNLIVRRFDLKQTKEDLFNGKTR